MHDLFQKAEALSERFEKVKEALALPEKRKRVGILEAESADPNLWSDQEKARKVTQELSDLKKSLKEVEELTGSISTVKELAETGELSGDFEKEINRLEAQLAKIELISFLSGEYDAKNAIVAIHSGQGGTEAMDWASMLMRMYLRFCERRGWITEVLDYSSGEEAGIKSVTIKVSGGYSYGYLKGESGTHRLVRQSPFNADKLRQTSFALVEVLPELSEVDLPNVQIKEEDLDWQFFRSSSQGGQNVQKVSTAARLIHKPTGVVVTAQSERFQEQNRKIALNLLRGKLWLLEKTKAESTKKEIKGEYRPASWGTQIRSYVLHPYKMVKDLRTEVETANTEAVLDGEIDEFVEAELKRNY
ncbi:peptide chain release factor 2 [Candidatus Woesebacteria bacterium]|nr:peptide chain release factor 2 [Candidatus Woesebacteria bacterium]